MARLTIRLLGHFNLAFDGIPVTTFNQTRLQALLACLLLQPEGEIERKRLAAMLWPETWDRQALSNLRTALTRIRQLLPHADDYLTVSPQTVRWHRDADVLCDVAEFRTLVASAEAIAPDNAAHAIAIWEKSVELYAGELLPGCQDHCVVAERERLRSAFLDVLDRLVQLLVTNGEHRKAIQYARRLTVADPLYEGAYRYLMRLYLLENNRTAALRVYHACASILRRELGVDPAPSTQALHLQLLNADATDIVPEEIDTELALTIQLGRPAFVNRTREFDELRAVWKRAAAGRIQFVLLHGDAGIGKTRLAEEFLAWLARCGHDTAVAHCYAGGIDLAYAPIAEWLRSPAVQARAQRLAPVWRRELARLQPELVEDLPAFALPEPMSDVWQQHRFFQALVNAVAGHASPQSDSAPDASPICLFLDDMHWCDAETLAWLSFLLHHKGLPILLAGTIRSEEFSAEGALAQWRRTIGERLAVTDIELTPLSPEHTAELAGAIAGHTLPAAFNEDLFRDSEGVPLFVVEAMQAEKDAGYAVPIGANGPAIPQKVQAMLARRLHQLSPGARELACTAAVIGRNFSLSVLAHASTQQFDAVIRHLDELWSKRIVREQGSDTYDFSHDKLRQAAYVMLSKPGRRYAHSRVAVALVACHERVLDQVASQVAFHFLEAGDLPQAATYYSHAAEAAEHVFANRDAIALYQAALAVAQSDATNDTQQLQVHFLEQIAHLYRRLGEWSAAGSALLDALALTGDHASIKRASLLQHLGSIYSAVRRSDDAKQAFQSAHESLNWLPMPHAPAAEIVRIDIFLSEMDWCYWFDTADAMDAIVSDVRPLVMTQGTQSQQLSFLTLISRVDALRRRYIIPDETVDDRRLALAIAQRSGTPMLIADARFGLGFMLLWSGKLDEATSVLEDAIHQAEAVGNGLLLAQGLCYAALCARRRCRPDEVQALLKRSLDAALACNRADYIGVAHANSAWLAWRNGDLRRAQEHGETTLRIWRDGNVAYRFCWVALWPLLGVALHRNELDAASGYARELLDSSQQPPPDRVLLALTAGMDAFKAGRHPQARIFFERAAQEAAAVGHL